MTNKSVVYSRRKIDGHRDRGMVLHQLRFRRVVVVDPRTNSEIGTCLLVEFTV